MTVITKILIPIKTIFKTVFQDEIVIVYFLYFCIKAGSHFATDYLYPILVLIYVSFLALSAASQFELPTTEKTVYRED